MNSVSLVIADDDIIICDMPQEFFATKEHINVLGVAHDGIELMPLLRATKPMVLLLDLVMPNSDGFHVLSLLQDLPAKDCPLVIALSALGQEPFMRRIQPYNIFYYLLKPFSLALLYQIIMEASTEQPRALSAKTPTETSAVPALGIGDMLCTLGMPPNFIGFSLLREGIRMTLDDPSLRYQITKSLYPRLATAFNSTADKVERNMRHAIQTAWSRSGTEIFEQVLHYRVVPRQPSISEFISLAIERLQVSHTA